MTKAKLEENIRDLIEKSGLPAADIADVLGTLHDEFEMIASDEGE